MTSLPVLYRKIERLQLEVRVTCRLERAWRTRWAAGLAVVTTAAVWLAPLPTPWG